MKITITEALAELNLIDKKITKKNQFITDNLYRYSHQTDIYKNDGGAKKLIEQEKQSIKDLENRKEKIRAGILKANMDNTIKIDKEKKTIYEWLVWKREIAANQINRLKDFYNSLNKANNDFKTSPKFYKNEEGENIISELIPHMDLNELQKEFEEKQEIYDKLDGLLSLKNATIVIELD
jgi:hypothetical protein